MSDEVDAAEQAKTEQAKVAYHRWYYDNHIWETTTWAGVPALKLPSDMWNYQEIILQLQPGLIIEFGRWYGGSTLFFASLLPLLKRPARILSVDSADASLDPSVRATPGIELMTCSSTDPAVGERIQALRQAFPGPAFAILDSDHSKAHVLAEMMSLRDLLTPGDYLLVEDSNINGHPVLPGYGEGPYEAIQEYFASYPDDYAHDYARERKFGLTFAPDGYLIRK